MLLKQSSFLNKCFVINMLAFIKINFTYYLKLTHVYKLKSFFKKVIYFFIS